MLKDKTIILGVCGGIAAYKAVELLRLYVKAGAEVHVVMTASAREFVTPLTFQTLTGNPGAHGTVQPDPGAGDRPHFPGRPGRPLRGGAGNRQCDRQGGIRHRRRSADDDADGDAGAGPFRAGDERQHVRKSALPARTKRSCKGFGCRFLEPVTGFLACGWEGKGKLPDPPAILEESERLLSPQDLAGETMLVTAGPTREDLDPVRFLSNRSSGQDGLCHRRCCPPSRRPASSWCSGPTCLAPPAGVETMPVSTARQMREAVLARLPATTVVDQSGGGGRLPSERGGGAENQEGG